MADIETAYRSFLLCINERRWDGLPSYMHYNFIKNGQDYPPESYTAGLRSVSGVELTIDALIVDRESQQHLVVIVLLSDPEAMYTPDWIGQEEPPAPRVCSSSDDKVPQWLFSRELEDKYRAYIVCINAQAMGAEQQRFCHAHVVHNTKCLTVDKYRRMIEESFAAIPDIVVKLHVVFADEQAQRVAARLELNGTPQGPSMLADATPNGRRVNFSEHVTYRFRRRQDSEGLEHRRLGVLPPPAVRVVVRQPPIIPIQSRSVRLVRKKTDAVRPKTYTKDLST
ncbi:hypothetical protein F4818DRAFT_436582 [Hypoxylon cercidicola]|nr:hypothetical protein F4818DRAFT_436582 [Hypoxylon cercidicola]